MGDTGETLRKLRAMLARGETIRQAAKILEKPPSTVHELAAKHDLPRRRPRPALTAEQKRKVQRLRREDAVRTLAQIAVLAGCSISAVWRLLNPPDKEPAAHEWVPQYTCPNGHKTIYRPCVICQAQFAAKRKPRPDNENRSPRS